MIRDFQYYYYGDRFFSCCSLCEQSKWARVIDEQSRFYYQVTWHQFRQLRIEQLPFLVIISTLAILFLLAEETFSAILFLCAEHFFLGQRSNKSATRSLLPSSISCELN